MSLDINLTNVQSKPIVVSANQTAENDRVYHVVANATFTDPTGVNGKGYEVFVRNGTATINSVAYTEGTTILRLFHSGAWVSYLGGGSQNLQQVTDIGSETTNSIVSLGGFVAFDNFSSPDNSTVLSPYSLELSNNPNGEQLFLNSNTIQFIKTGGANGMLKVSNVTNSVTLEFPNKPTGSYTIATTADIPDTSDFVEKSDFTSHSILAKQSGAGDPVAVSIGNNEILGRKSGGGSNIEGLSVSEVKSLLNYTASDVGAVATNSAITGATKTKITYDAKGLVTSGADATTADIADSTNKRYVTDANLTVIGNTSNTNTGDETQSTILSKLGFYRAQINTASITVNTVVETIVGNILIPANTYTASGGIFEFNMFAVKSSNVGQIIIKAYISQISNNIGSATQIATTGNLSVNSRYAPFRRKLNFDGTDLIGFPFGTGASNDDAISSVAIGSNTFDETIDNYLIFAITLLSLSDNAHLQFAEFKNF